jgi:hypothetical protein
LEITGGGITIVKDEDRGFGTEIYPNPSKGIFQFVSEQAGHLQVYDLSGRVMHRMVLEKGVQTVDISGVNSGAYIVEIISEGKREVRKILIR